MNKNILFEHSAVKMVLEYLKIKPKNIEYINRGRYAIAYAEQNIAIILKKEWFQKFGQMFSGERGIGDSINRTDIKEFVKRNVKDIYVIHKSGTIYTIPISLLLQKAHLWTNKEGKEVYSYSIHIYQRVNKDKN